MNLLEELGKPLTVTEIAEILGIDQRTVRKYAYDLEGVWIAGRWRFFENRIRRIINASTMQTTRQTALESQGDNRRPDESNQVVRRRQTRRQGIQESSRLGGGEKEGNPIDSENGDPHKLFDN